MTRIGSVGAALLLTTSVATAGGIERSVNPYGILFEDGQYMELSFSKVTPSVSGDYPAALGGGSTGNMAGDYGSASFGVKFALNDQFDVGLFLNQPFGADAFYSQGVYTGLGADWSSRGFAAVLKYQATPNISVYGGARAVRSTADITIPDALIRGSAAASLQEGIAAATAAGDVATATALGTQLAGVAGAPAGAFNYDAQGAEDSQTSYIAGVAYERPEIALRVALTYESGYTHEFDTVENLPGAGLVGFASVTEVEMPDTVTLDFQTGVAADTLVFGSVRWAEWSAWEVRPAGYEGFTGDAVTGFDNDTTTWTLGVGRRLNDQFSVFGRVSFEDSTGGEVSRLAPSDGRTSVGLGGSYTMDGVEVRGGIEWISLGDATDGSGVEFADNSVVGVGLTIGTSF